MLAEVAAETVGIIGALGAIIAGLQGWMLKVMKETKRDTPSVHEVHKMIQTQAPYVADKKFVNEALARLANAQATTQQHVSEVAVSLKVVQERQRQMEHTTNAMAAKVDKILEQTSAGLPRGGTS